MTVSPDNGPLSDKESREFQRLLERFCVHQLDQWERWRLGTPYGEAYIHTTRRPVEGAPPSAYDELSPSSKG